MADYHDDPLVGQTLKSRSIDATALQGSSTYGMGLLVESGTNTGAQISQIGYQGGEKPILLVGRVRPSDASHQIWGYSDLTAPIIKINDIVDLTDQPGIVTAITSYPGLRTSPMIQGLVATVDGITDPSIETFLVNPHMLDSGTGLKFSSFNDVTAGTGSIFTLLSHGTYKLFEVSVQAETRIFRLGTSFYSGFSASASQAANVHYTLPVDDGNSGQVLSTDGAGVLSWIAVAATWSDISDPTANLSLNMAAYTTTFTWNAATGANDLFTLTDTAGNTGTGAVFSVQTQAGSAACPLEVVASGLPALTICADGIFNAAAYLNNATGDETAFTFNYTTNKATSGNDTGIKIINTDTASPGTSLFLDMQSPATTSRFSVTNLGNVLASGSITGTGVVTTSAEAFYLGDPTTDGTWQFIRSGNDLLVRRRESGVYVTKGQWTP